RRIRSPGGNRLSGAAPPRGERAAFELVGERLRSPQARLRADGTRPARARGRPARLARVCEGRRGGRRVIERYLGALAAELGSVALVAIAVYAYEYSAGLPGWQKTFVFVAAGAAVIPVAALSVVLARISRLRPQAPGPAGDVFDDLAPLVDLLPLRLRGHPW